MSNSTESTGQLVGSTPERTRPGQSLQGILVRGAEAWNLSRNTTVAILIAPAFVAASGIVAALLGKDVFKWFAEEDGFAETMQVVMYSAAWIMCLLVTRYQAQAKNRLITVLYILLACGLFFLIGEEVSWGQRIFGWGTPESLAAINKQEETNLHNIYGVGSTFKWIQGLVGAYGAILPLVFLRTHLLPAFRQLIDAVVPHYTLILYFLPMFIWRLYRNLSDDPVRYYYFITNYNEVIELILAMGFCLFMAFQLRKCRREFGKSVTAR